MHLCTLYSSLLSTHVTSYTFVSLFMIYALCFPISHKFALLFPVPCLLQNIMQSSLGCWISVAAIFILLITKPSIESSSAFHRADQYHHNSLFRRFTNFRKVPPGYQRSVLPSPLQPGEIGQAEIDPRYETDERLIPGGPNPLHNWTLPKFYR